VWNTVAKSAPRTEMALSRGPAESVLTVRELSKSYQTRVGHRLVLNSINLDVRRGEFVCVVGPSGAGKTTLLRCMSGLLAPTAGQVLLDGELVSRPPAKLAVVFQDYSRSLMPWMLVEGNVMLPLRAKGMRSARCRELAMKSLAAVGLAEACHQYPWQLSGGMQQRVAIARALAYEPEVLLMDEPFASVDAQTRADLEDLALDLRASFGVTVVLVTHDIDESVYLGDRVIVLSGSPTQIRDDIAIDLPTPRDQVGTKVLPRFAELRARILQEIRQQ
jgi:NitT/TauT family transport system ATP-binding protein